MKIYEIGTGYTPIPSRMGAATEIVVEELTKSMLRAGKEVQIVDIQSRDRLEHSLPIIEVKVPRVFCGTDVKLGVMHKVKRVVYSINLASKLKQILKGSDEKVILHFHNQYNLFFFLKLVSRVLREKCIIAYTNHSYIWHGEWNEIESVIQKRYFQEVFAMRNADLVYVLNETTEKNIIEHIGTAPEKVILIDNGVNTDVYKPIDKAEIEQFKAQCGLSEKRIFIQVGSVCERKNQIGAVQLLLPILKEDSNTVFAYAGGIISQEYQVQLENYARENGIEKQVKYLGEIKPGMELNRYYNLADAMIFPSKAEGFSLVIIEAMAAGVPVLVNQSLQFKLAEECLRYEDVDFINIMKSRILDAEKLQEEAINARKVVVEKYSWNMIADKYVESWNAINR